MRCAKRHSDDAMTASGHARLGWWMLAVFAGAGLVIESMIGLRTPWLLDVGMETRRVMFRLAHAHGALLGLVNVAFAASLRTGIVALDGPELRWPSRLLVTGSVCVPLGFALGGLWFVEADPGPGVVLVPIGALAVVAALVSIARAGARS
jgi:hypothetical protein